MRCPECAAPADEDAPFCGACGALLRSRPDRAPTSVTPTRQDPPGHPPADEEPRREPPADRAPRWLAAAIALLLLAGVAAVAPRLTREPPPGVGSLDGERWRATLDTEPSFRFTNLDPSAGTAVGVAAGVDRTYVASRGTVAAYGSDRGDRRWQRVLPAPRSPTVAGPVLVVATDRGVVGLDRASGEIRWEQPASSAVRIATDGERRVFLAETTGLTAVDAADGRPRWSVPTVRGSSTYTVVAGSGSLVVAADGVVRGLVPADGTLDWERNFSRPLSSPPVTGDGNVYLETDPGEVIALDLLTGRERWRASSPPEFGTLTATRGVVIRWTRNGGTVGLAANDGRALWAQPARTLVPPLVDEDTVYMPRRSPGRIVAFDAMTAVTRWSQPRPPAIPVAAVGGRLYLAGQDTVVAWDSEDGTERWRVSPSRPDRPPGYPTPVVTDDRVYVTTVGGPLVALERASGEERWRLDPRDLEDELPTETPSGTTSVALPLGDRVIVASNRAVYAVDAASGASVASFPTSVAPGAVPVLAGGHIVINLGPSLIGLDRDSLALRWQYTTPSPGARIGSHPVTAPTVHGELVLVGGGGGTLAALDPVTGDPAWDLDLGSAIVSRPAVEDGIIVLRTETGDVRAFEAETGRAIWRQSLSPTELSDPAVAGGSVYAADGGELIALDAGTGVERWRTDLGGGDLSSPNAVGDVVYIGSTAGEVVAVGGGAGEVRWRFPAGAPVGAPPAVTDEELIAVTDDGAAISLH